MKVCYLRNRVEMHQGCTNLVILHIRGNHEMHCCSEAHSFAEHLGSTGSALLRDGVGASLLLQFNLNMNVLEDRKIIGMLWIIST